MIASLRPAQFMPAKMLHGLSYLQKLGIAHRDLRSDNVLVNSAGVAKIGEPSGNTLPRSELTIL